MPSKRTYFFTFFLMFQLGVVWSQSTDSLYQQARTLALNGERENARELCNAILSNSPLHGDATVLLSRTYAWDKQYDKALTILQNYLAEKPDNKEALQLKLQILYWKKDYRAVISEGERLSKTFPDNREVLSFQYKAFIQLKEYEEAKKINDRLLQLFPKEEEFLENQKKLKELLAKNLVGVVVKDSYFSQHKNHRTGTALQYIRRANTGTFILHYNFANWFEKNAHQLDLDGYIPIRKGLYTYANIGFSSSNLFPELKHALEPFANISGGYELSLGYRYMQFSNSKVWLYTGSIGKYHKNFLFSLRAFASKKDVGYSSTFVLTARKFIPDRDNWVDVQLNFGTSPDQTYLGAQLQDIAYVHSYKISTNLWKMLSYRFQLRAQLFYQYFDYQPTFNVFGGQIGLFYKF